MLLIMNSFNVNLTFAIKKVYYISIYILCNMNAYNEALINNIYIYIYI